MRTLPLEYAVRNLMRRPLRTGLTAIGFALVAALWMATTAFVQGLSSSVLALGDDDTALVLSSVAPDDVVRSTVGASVARTIEAGIKGISAVSQEIHMATNLHLGAEPRTETDPVYQGFVRGVTTAAYLVHDAVTLLEGRLPEPGEVLVGNLVAARLSVPAARLAVGQSVQFEGGTYRISGIFSAKGTTIGSEIFAPLTELQGRVRRDDVSVVFVRFADLDAFGDLEAFTRRRLDLELVAVPTRKFYADAAAYFRPIQMLAYALASMIALATLFSAANTISAAVSERTKELATLRAVGFGGGALVLSLLVEALLLAAAGALCGLVLARFALTDTAFRIAMAAFALEVDGFAVLTGAVGALIVAATGALPAMFRILRMPIASALKGHS